MTSYVAFPSVSSPPSVHPGSSKSALSVSSRQATALEVCDLVYGSAEPPSWDVLERMYEANAGENSLHARTALEALTDHAPR